MYVTSSTHNNTYKYSTFPHKKKNGRKKTEHRKIAEKKEEKKSRDSRRI